VQESFTYFYIPPAMVSGEEIAFQEDESHHIAKVCRKQVGDEIYAVDGIGNRYHIRLTLSNPQRVEGTVLNTDLDVNEPHTKLSLALPWTRDPKLDLIITRATELGVSKFVYYTADKSIIKNDDDRIEKKIERHRRLGISAIKQSLRCVLPEMKDIGRSHNFENCLKYYDVCLYADLNKDALPIQTALRGLLPKWIILVIGPESGFSREEKITLESAGALPISLGPRRLRFETAALAFTSVAMSILGEMQ
jgi:16S rRNA (uracil1498-N3)-methyltransferase